jgi:hypothetical protein
MAREKMTPASWIAQPRKPRERVVQVRSRMAPGKRGEMPTAGARQAQRAEYRGRMLNVRA